MNALFISNKAHLTSLIPGGVQICTNEFKELLLAAGMKLKFFELETTKSFFKRAKIKLKLDVFDYYDIEKYFSSLKEIVVKEEINLIIINQVNLAQFAKLLKDDFGDKVKTVVLSHGNESGDYLHEILNTSSSFLKIWKIGSLLVREAQYFHKYIDLLIVISEIEKNINQWMGSLNCIFIPRTIPEAKVIWTPSDNKRVGFIGTLNHLPNLKGLESLAKELDNCSFKGELRVIGGPEEIGKKLERKYRCLKYVGFIPNDEMMCEVSSWAIFANAIFWYSRGCSTKLAQIISWGIPIVTTLPGVRGYEWSNGSPIFAKSPRDMAEKIISHLDDPEMLKIQHEEILKIKASSPSLDEMANKLKTSIESLFSDKASDR